MGAIIQNNITYNLQRNPPSSHSWYPNVLRYAHKGEQMRADTRSDMHKLTMKRLVTVRKCLLVSIVYMVTTCPSDPTTINTMTVENIAMLEVLFVTQLDVMLSGEKISRKIRKPTRSNFTFIFKSFHIQDKTQGFMAWTQT